MALLLGALGAVALATDAGASIYWGSWSQRFGGDGAIGIAKPSGGGIDHRFVSSLDDLDDITAATPRQLAVGADSLYWTVNHHVGRASVDGTGENRELITDPDFPFDVSVNADHVYWISQDEAGNSGTISRAKLDGSGVEIGFMKAPDVVALAVDESHIYWAAYGISRANLDGTGARTVVADVYARDLALDGQSIYWAQDSAIGRARLDGTAAAPRFLDAGSPALSVAVDDGHIYWVNGTASDLGGPSFGETIGRAALDGTSLERTFVTTQGQTGGVAADSRTFPVTKVKKRSHTPRSNRFTFTFRSDEPESTFECRIDRKPFTPCRSPKVVKLRRRGVHTIRVRAIDAAGNVDPTPVEKQFRVTR